MYLCEQAGAWLDNAYYLLTSYLLLLDNETSESMQEIQSIILLCAKTNLHDSLTNSHWSMYSVNAVPYQYQYVQPI